MSSDENLLVSPSLCTCGVALEMMDITVQATTGTTFKLRIATTDTVDYLRRIIAKKTKISKERIVLLFREGQLRDGSLQDYRIADGSKIQLLPTIETGLLSQRPEHSVMQALESLNDTQVTDFLSGKAPLNLTMRLGDHMMLIQLQLSTVSPVPRQTYYSRRSHPYHHTYTPDRGPRTPTPKASSSSRSALVLGTTTTYATSSSSSSSRSARHCKPPHPDRNPPEGSYTSYRPPRPHRDQNPSPHHDSPNNFKSYPSSSSLRSPAPSPRSHAPEMPVRACCHVFLEPPSGSPQGMALNSSALAVASRNLTQTLRQLSTEIPLSGSNPPAKGEKVRPQTATPAQPIPTPPPPSRKHHRSSRSHAPLPPPSMTRPPLPKANLSQGAIIESMQHHGKGVFSGTFSGTLNPALQDPMGRPKRDISTIVHILNDLLSAAPHYPPLLSAPNPAPSPSPPKSPTAPHSRPGTAAENDRMRKNIQEIQDKLRAKSERRKERRLARSNGTPYQRPLRQREEGPSEQPLNLMRGQIPLNLIAQESETAALNLSRSGSGPTNSLMAALSNGTASLSMSQSSQEGPLIPQGHQNFSLVPGDAVPKEESPKMTPAVASDKGKAKEAAPEPPTKSDENADDKIVSLNSGAVVA